MIARSELVEIIINTVRDFAPGPSEELPKELDENSRLFGDGGLLDSVGLVSVVLDVEQVVNDRLKLSLTIADDRAMSRRHSPFRSVGSLADYVLTQVGELRPTLDE